MIQTDTVSLKNKTVLITGISGFTGQKLAEHLRSLGAIVYGISSNLEDPENLCFKIALSDQLTLSNVVERIEPDFVIHLAGIAYTAHANGLPYYETNVIGTENLLKSCLSVSHKIEKVILASSAAVYGYPKQDFISERHSVNPTGHYGVSKLAMEFIAESFREKLNILIVRPFNYTGSGQSKNFLVPKIVEHFKMRKAEIELGNTHVLREFGDVRDIIEIYARLLQSNSTETLNLCNGVASSIDNVLETLTDITGQKIEIKVNPDFVRKNDIKRLVGDKSLLEEVTQYAHRYTLKDTLTAMLNAT